MAHCVLDAARVIPDGFLPRFCGGGCLSLLQFQGISALAPGREAAGQGTHAQNSMPLQQEGHTGTRGFVGSSAVKDDVAIREDFGLPLLELLRIHVEGSGYGRRVSLEIERMAEINYLEVLAGIELAL
jgi:hypothetical protein